MTNKKKPFVLVVEDDMNSQMLMKYYLGNSYEIDFAVSVTKAKEKLKNQHVDIILLDLALEGGEDGLDLARYIRKEGKWPGICIIATTAHAFAKDRDNCIAAGCNDYLSKPIKREKLLEKISEFA
ncbi:MAG: response regulator [Candidatus Marinimicrobia bacterium]|nr:response regulator [Candidatus Neomarinimicrobiota bacterium]